MDKKRKHVLALADPVVEVALVAIVSSVGVSHFRDGLMNSRVTTQANAFVAAINLARSEPSNGDATSLSPAATQPTRPATQWLGRTGQ